VVIAARALDGPDRSGKIILNLNDFTSHTFDDLIPLRRMARPRGALRQLHPAIERGAPGPAAGQHECAT
jgi:hypothetical protein